MVLGIEQEPPVCQDNCSTTQLHPGLCGDSLNRETLRLREGTWQRGQRQSKESSLNCSHTSTYYVLSIEADTGQEDETILMV